MRTETTHDYAEAWDIEDVRTLRALRRRGWMLQDIADHMGRTRAAVASKLWRLRH